MKRPHPSPQDALAALRSDIDAVRPRKGRPKRGRPTHEQLVDNARRALLARKTVTVRTAEEAVAIWKDLRLGRRGSRVEDPLPRLERAPTPVGLPVDEQVALMVEQTPFFDEWRAGSLGADAEPFLSELQAQLPQEFGAPWPGLCDAEQDALYAEARARLAGDTGLTPEKGTKDEDGRLLPGFERQNEG